MDHEHQSNTVTTKFKPGSSIYLLVRNKIIPAKVLSVEIKINSQQINISYEIITSENRYDAKEDSLFISKQELVDQLLLG